MSHLNTLLICLHVIANMQCLQYPVFLWKGWSKQHKLATVETAKAAGSFFYQVKFYALGNSAIILIFGDITWLYFLTSVPLMYHLVNVAVISDKFLLSATQNA